VLRRTSSEALHEVLEQAAHTPLKEFVISLQRDVNAVQGCARATVDDQSRRGQISRLKMLKRSMYGRAGFELLGARVLYAA
jgi:transposase